MSLHAIVCLTYRSSVKSVGFYDVGTSLEIFLVNLSYDIRTCKVQYIVITFYLLRHIGKQITPEIAFCQIILLYHSTQRPIEYQYTSFDLRFEFREC